MKTTHEKIQIAFIAAKQKFDETGEDMFADIRSKLEFVLSSFESDGNPVGLYEIGAQALYYLQKLQETSPKSVSKKSIGDLEKALASQHSLNYQN